MVLEEELDRVLDGVRLVLNDKRYAIQQIERCVQDIGEKMSIWC